MSWPSVVVVKVVSAPTAAPFCSVIPNELEAAYWVSPVISTAKSCTGTALTIGGPAAAATAGRFSAAIGEAVCRTPLPLKTIVEVAPAAPSCPVNVTVHWLAAASLVNVAVVELASPRTSKVVIELVTKAPVAVPDLRLPPIFMVVLVTAGINCATGKVTSVVAAFGLITPAASAM